MAAQSKTTAVHFSLIIFVMLSVILGVVALLFFNDYRNQQAQFEQNKSDLADAERASQQYIKEIEDLKKIIGVEAAEVGTGGADEGTVLGQAGQAIKNLGTNPASASFMVAMKDLRTELNNLNTQLAQRDATIKDLETKLSSLDKNYASVAAEHDQVRQTTEQDLETVQVKFDESIAAKDQQVTDLREETETLQANLDRTEEQLGGQLAEAQRLVTNLQSTVRMLRLRLDRAEGLSFEKADGVIRNVDQVGRTVWINIGSDAGLKPGVTFSIYTKNNTGVGRANPSGGRPEDIKGKIEVTEILSENMAEARILDEDGSRPIAPGDPIYTPLWGAGRSEQFAFAGALDIDGDGNMTGDRERLYEIVKSNGGEVASDLLVTGERRGGEIDQNTRFLVKGEIPKPEDAAPNTPEQQQYRTLNIEYGKMQAEAESNGVRVIGLNTFLDFIGFVPQQNTFVPGASKNWRLDAGAPDRPDRSSRGNTSALFDTSRNRPNSASETSQTFEGQE